MRLCPRCHAQHPDHILVCHSEVCGTPGTPLVVRQHTVTQPVIEMPPGPAPPPVGASPGAPRSGARSGARTPPPVEPTGSIAGDGDSAAFDPQDSSDLAQGSSPTMGLRGPKHERQARASTPPRPRGGVKDRAEDSIGLVLGSYRLLEVIGRGGMGRVYRAEHVRLGRQVALKLLKPEYAVKRDAVARFFQEAKAVNKIRHRNIVDVTDFVELDDGTTFIIMELLEGASLGKVVRTEGPMAEGRLLAILVQVCDALEAAHAVGIVHRDLKPDNVFLVASEDASGEIAKLLDFGVAKLLAAPDDDAEPIGYQTAAGSVVGTPAYMSPEQAGGLDVDGRSDVYALGAIMYELFCGRPVFTGKSFGEFVMKHMSELPVPPRQTEGGAGLRPELEAVILRCLAKRPTERFQTVGELRDALLGLLGVLDTGLVELRRMESGRSSGLRVSSSGGHRSSGAGLGSPLPSVPGLTVPPLAEADADPSVTSAETRMAIGDLRNDRASTVRGGGRGKWLLAGLMVVGFGAAAIYVATRGDEGEPATAARSDRPTVAPLAAGGNPQQLTDTRPAAPPARAKITMALRTDPVSAQVYPFGSDEALCTTPCELTIDPDDGGSTTRRTFPVRKVGHQPYQLEVPLDGSAPTEQLVLLMPEETPVVEATDPAPPRGGKSRPGKNDRGDRGDRTDRVAPPPADPPPVETKVSPPADTPPADPPPPKKKDKIDRADTLDPFGNPK
jgi:serine/threonine protein kinase